MIFIYQFNPADMGRLEQDPEDSNPDADGADYNGDGSESRGSDGEDSDA